MAKKKAKKLKKLTMVKVTILVADTYNVTRKGGRVDRVKKEKGDCLEIRKEVAEYLISEEKAERYIAPKEDDEKGGGPE